MESGNGVRKMGREGERYVPLYDLWTGPERAQAEIDDLAGRVRRMETQLSQEIRAIEKRLQHVEYLLEQFSGDSR